LRQLGAIDVTGGAVVHMTGGIAGLMGAIMVGPRLGRFDHQTGAPKDFPGHNMTVASLGMFILWYSWYAYTSASALGITDGRWMAASRAALVTTLAGGMAMISSVCLRRMQTNKYELATCICGLLAGLVSITGCASLVDPWAAIIIGFIGGLVFVGGSTLVLKLKVDDPLDVSAIHIGCGAWSVLAVSFFAKEEFVNEVFSNRDNIAYGLFYGSGLKQFGLQLLMIVMVFVWVGVITGACFWTLKKFHFLRIDADTELAGLDNTEHGGSAYVF